MYGVHAVIVPTNIDSSTTIAATNAAETASIPAVLSSFSELTSIVHPEVYKGVTDYKGDGQGKRRRC